MKKTLIFIVGILIFINMISAFTWTGVTSYWNMDNNVDSINAINLQPKEGTAAYNNTNCLIGNCSQISTNNNLKLLGNTLDNFTNNFSYNVWVRFNNTVDTEYFFGRGATFDASTGHDPLAFYAGSEWFGGAAFTFSSTTYTNKTFHMWTFTRNNTNVSFFMDGVLKKSGTTGTISGNPAFETALGTRGAGDFDMFGQLDEMSYFNSRILNSTEILELFNGGAGLGLFSTLILNNPINNGNYVQNQNILFNCSIFFASNTINNITLYINGILNYTYNNPTLNYLELNKVNTLSTGSYNYSCQSRDSNNNQYNSTFFNFNVSNYAINNYTYDSIAYETSTESYILNLSVDSIGFPVISATFNYNNTQYPVTITGSIGNYILSSTLNLPLINTANVNNTFYWTLGLTNTSGTFYYNSSFNNQSVYAINLGSCGGINTTLAINLTAYDQYDLTKLNNWSVQGTLNYFISNSTSAKSFTLNAINISEKDICINVNTTFRVTGMLNYFLNNSYQAGTFAYVNTPISNITTNTSLLILPITRTSVFIIKVLDQFSIPAPNFYVNIQRYYPASNSYNTVQTVLTDSNGQSVSFIEINNVQYRFQVLDSQGNLIYTSTPTVITPQSSPYTITINIPPTSQTTLTYNRNITGVTYNLNYNPITDIVTFAYTDSNISFQKAELNVLQTNGAFDISICDNNLSNPNGIITCNVSNYTGSFKALTFIYRGDIQYYVNNLLFDNTNFNSGGLGLFGGICILLVCAFMFAYNEVAGLIAIDIGVIVINMLGFINFGWMVVSSIVAMSIIMLIVLDRG